MADRILKITFTGDSTGAEKAFRAAGDAAVELETQTKGLGGHLADVAKIGAGFALGAGVAAAPGYLMDAAKAAAEDEAASARLAQSIRNLGGDYDEISGKVDKAIADGQKLAFSDDEVRDSFQSLAAATGDADEALKRQRAAMDLARGANIPLATATKMLGKLNGENVEVFKKLGITLGDTATEADALAAVQAKFGGQAEEFASSTAGQFEQAKLQMGELQESIGAALLPVMTVLAGVLSQTLVPALQTFADEVVPKITTVGEGAVGALGAVEPILVPLGAAVAAAAAVILATMVPAALAWAAAEVVKTAALIASAAAFVAANAPIIAIAAAVALLVAGIVLLVQHWDTVTEKVPALGVAFDAVKAVIEAFIGWITGTLVPAIGKIATAVSDAVEKAVGFVRDHWDEIRGVIEPGLKAVAAIVEAQWNQVRIYFETAFKVIKGLVDVFIGVFTGDWGRAKDGVLDIVNALKDGIVDSIKNALDLVKALGPMALDAAKAIGGMMIDGLKAGWSAIGDAFISLGDALREGFKTAWNAAIDWADRNFKLSFEVMGHGVSVDPDLSWAKLARGLWEVPGTRGAGDVFPAMLSPGEMVVPAAAADRMRAGAVAGGGGVVVNIHGPVYARDAGEARQAAGDLGALVMARLRAKGVA